VKTETTDFQGAAPRDERPDMPETSRDQTAGPGGRPLRLKKPPADPEQTTGTPGPAGTPGQPSSFLRKLLWTALIAWLLALGFFLLDPLPLLFPGDDPHDSLWRTAPSPDTPPEQTPERHPALTVLLQDVAAALLARDPNAAMTLVLQQQKQPERYPYPDDLSTLAHAVTAVKYVNLRVADLVREHIDEELQIHVRNRTITIIPRASAGERVNALIVPTQTNRPPQSKTFKITDLAPAERARLIGKADTPTKALMKLYLHLEAGDKESARAYAPGCGLLGPALSDQLGSTSP
jgi:hypothetical protein